MTRAWIAATVGALVLAAAACGGGDPAGPRADWIEPALAEVEAAVGDEPALLEVAATIEHVDVIVQDGEGRGVLYRYDDDGLAGPIEPRDDPRAPFAPDAVTIDPDRIFDGIRSELEDATIIDLAVRNEGEALVIDATVASDQGGILLVLLRPDGTIIGSQAA